MDFASVVLVLLVYFIRPQDWVPGLIGVGIITPIMAVAILAMVARARTEGRKLKILATPIDWAMLVYYVFIVLNHPDSYETFKNALPLFAFYVVTSQALRSIDRVQSYLGWWLTALVVLAGFGVGSKFGFDPTGAVAMTEANKGRLALGTWMHDNPNALGHSVALVVPVAYYLCFWKSTLTKRLQAVLVSWLAFECVWLTESKGAVLAGFATLVLGYVFGKSRFVQIIVLAAAVAGGGAAMSVMPRMQEMGSLRSDEGVQGRLLAWEQARTASQNDYCGQGWKTFRATIRWEKQWISKATHSGYVQVGAELGPVGMVIYVGILWLGFRTLLRCGSLSTDAERCRRCLFVLLFGFAISNWMIDRAYHTEFFLFLGAISALHRIVLLDPASEKLGIEAAPVASPPAEPISTPWILEPQPLLAMAGSQSLVGQFTPEEGMPPNLTSGRELRRGKLLTRPGLEDVLIAVAGAWLVFYIWDYILKNL